MIEESNGPRGSEDKDASTAAPQETERQRAERSDKGKPRLYIRVPGVTYDLSEPEGMETLVEMAKGWPPRVAQITLQLLELVSRLAAKK